MTRSSKDQDDYRDDPAEFGQSSDLARTGTSGVTTGGGPADSSKDPAGTSPGAGNNAGSQEDWRGPKAAAPEAEWTPKEAEDDSGLPTNLDNLDSTRPDGARDAPPAAAAKADDASGS